MSKKTDFQIQQDLYFLGPKGEQRKFLQEMIELINNDVVFWRRNFWPKDPPHIPYGHFISPVGQDHQDKFIQSLVQLLAELKMDVPFFSPRYIAHMTGDVSLPGLIGYYAGLMYNSNNVSAEASPVTLKYELEVGQQFAQLFGFDSLKSFGHITSGGTVANFESVFYAKAARFIPASMGLLLKREGLPWADFLPQSLWKLLNIPLEDLPALLSDFEKFLSTHGVNAGIALPPYTIAHLGEYAFWQALQEGFKEEVGRPVLLVPATAHYSWSKAAHLFGLGKENCLQVKVDRQLRMSMNEFNESLKFCQDLRRPVIQTVCILGSTEYGTFDPLDEMVELLRQYKALGLYSPLHVDAAYGGYFQCMFKQGERYPDRVRASQEKFKDLYQIFEALKNVDSVTVDPHKLGHTPYGAGVFVTKHGFTKEFIAEEADYCLSAQEEASEPSLGKYIIEGSKPGASAVSVYFSNKIIPLNSDGYGGLMSELLRITGDFHQRLLRHNQDAPFAHHFEFVPIAAPASNLLCFFVRTKAETSVTRTNAFNDQLIWHFFPRATDHIQEFSYYLSKTKLKFSKLSELPEAVKGMEKDSEQLRLIRLVFLNRWVEETNGRGESYMEDFILELKRKCFSLLPK